MTHRMMRWFTWAHLPDNLQPTSRLCWRLAEEMDKRLPEGMEKSAGMHNLVQAKDWFVRAQIEGEEHD